MSRMHCIVIGRGKIGHGDKECESRLVALVPGPLQYGRSLHVDMSRLKGISGESRARVGGCLAPAFVAPEGARLVTPSWVVSRISPLPNLPAPIAFVPSGREGGITVSIPTDFVATVSADCGGVVPKSSLISNSHIPPVREFLPHQDLLDSGLAEPSLGGVFTWSNVFNENVCSSSVPLADETGLELGADPARCGGKRWKKQARHWASGSLDTPPPVECVKRARDYEGAGISDVVVEFGKFTWCNNRASGLVRERLDRGLANDEWQTLFPEAHLHTLVSSVSDHSPILVDCFGLHRVRPQPGPRWGRVYHFEVMWLREEACEQVVANCWNGDVSTANVDGLQSNIVRTSAKLKGWSRNQFGHLQHQLRVKTKRLEWLRL
ncbi:hypothetical protein LOK49_LG11G00272 [Camellia lanceoleosa]|uniref:Uncharacterized protein n=1 Tax=Camellia lanceoleosa TaxID=1840588 RepID=A0ACC0G5W4_9ERIC|nr:hypothetical protein LOK49_LG11G00272 [Camellia lanceoleosa]